MDTILGRLENNSFQGWDRLCDAGSNLIGQRKALVTNSNYRYFSTSGIGGCFLHITCTLSDCDNISSRPGKTVGQEQTALSAEGRRPRACLRAAFSRVSSAISLRASLSSARSSSVPIVSMSRTEHCTQTKHRHSHRTHHPTSLQWSEDKRSSQMCCVPPFAHASHEWLFWKTRKRSPRGE